MFCIDFIYKIEALKMFFKNYKHFYWLKFTYLLKIEYYLFYIIEILYVVI